MVLPLIPLAVAALPSIIGAIGGLFGGGGKEGESSSGGSDLAKTAALGSVLAQPGGSGPSGKEVITDHPVTKGTDLPPILAAALTGTKSGHMMLPQAGKRGVLHAPLEQAIAQMQAKQATEPVRRHQEKAARATVRRVNQSVAPHLEEMRKHLRDRAVQVQATAEHRALVQRDQRWRELADKQRQIIQKLDRIGAQLRGRWTV